MLNSFQYLFFSRLKAGYAATYNESPRSGLSAFSPSPDAYASPSPLKGEGKKGLRTGEEGKKKGAACRGKGEGKKAAACEGREGKKECGRR